MKVTVCLGSGRTGQQEPGKRQALRGRFRVRYLKYLAFLIAVVALPAMHSQAQVAIGVQIGPSYGIYNAPPVCEYGFYPTYPFGCAPYGYYGANWFVDGIFIGAGPWYNFYFTHPTYYRPYFVNRGFGFHPGFERFHDGDRFRSVEHFRGEQFENHGFRHFDRDDFRGRDYDRGRSFREARGYRDGDRDDRDRGRPNYGGGRPNYGGGNGYRRPEEHGGSHYAGG